MSTNPQILLYPRFPLWRGVQPVPGVRDSFPFALVRDGCGFIRQDSPQDVMKAVISSYAADGHSFITQPPGTSLWANRLGDELAEFALDVVRASNAARIAEIGAGSLYVAKKVTATATVARYVVVDPAIHAVASINAGIEAIPSYFAAGILEPDEFDAILSFNCLEHVADPIGFLHGIRAALRPGGRTGIVIPDIDKQFPAGDFNALLHEHLSYFDRATAVDLFHRCGFRVTGCESRDDTIFLLAEATKEAVATANEVGESPTDGKIAPRFAASLAVARERLALARASGQVVAFHGATNGLNNLLFLLEEPVPAGTMLFDGDEAKTGMFLPAFPYPIQHGSNPLYQAADVVFISAMTYFDPIKQFIVDHVGLAEERIFPLFDTVSSDIDASPASKGTFGK